MIRIIDFKIQANNKSPPSEIHTYLDYCSCSVRRIVHPQHVSLQMLLAMEKVFTDLTQVFTKTTSAASRISLCLRHEGVRSW